MYVWVGTFAANSLIFGSGLLSSILAARLLGVDDRGLLAAIVFWPHLLAGFASMGLNESIVTHTSRNGMSASLRSTAVAASLLLAVIIAIPAVLAMPMLMGARRAEFVVFCQIYISVFVPLTFVAQNLLAVEHGSQRFAQFNAQRIIQASVYPTSLAAFWFFGVLNVQTAAVAVISGTTVVALMRLWKSRKCLLVYPSLTEGIEVLREGCKIHGVNLISHLNAHIDKLALVLLATDRQLGLYVVALAAAGVSTQLFVQTYVNVMLPRATKSLGHLAEYHFARTSILLLFGLVALASAILYPLMPWLVSSLFGEEFLQAVVPAQLLLIATGSMAVKKAVIYLLRSQKIHHQAVRAEIITGISLIVTVFPAFKLWGVEGVCLSLASAQILGLVYAMVRFYRLSADDILMASVKKSRF